MTESPKLQSVF